MANIGGLMVEFIKASGRKASWMVREKCGGLMEVTIRVKKFFIFQVSLN